MCRYPTMQHIRPEGEENILESTLYLRESENLKVLWPRVDGDTRSSNGHESRHTSHALFESRSNTINSRGQAWRCRAAIGKLCTCAVSLRPPSCRPFILTAPFAALVFSLLSPSRNSTLLIILLLVVLLQRPQQCLFRVCRTEEGLRCNPPPLKYVTASTPSTPVVPCRRL